MKFNSSVVRNSLLLIAVCLALPGFRASAQTTPDNSAAISQAASVPSRITQAIDETQLVRLKGNVHPLARPEFDQGAVADATPMKRMMLLLQRSPEQQAALKQFMDEQLSKDSPNFHNWLTPDQFGKLYGPADADIQTVAGWLTSQGFSGVRVNRGKTVIEFTGNAGQVRNAFRTEIRKFLVNGENRQANTSDPQIPAALSSVVAGIVSLHNFPSRSMRHVAGVMTGLRPQGRSTPQFTTSGGDFALAPADFAKIYNIPSTLNGTGGNIAIVGFSSIDVNDAHAFRALFGLPVNDPVVVNNGPDPGFGSEEGEADLDTQWSGAVAPMATIHYVLSEGTFTSDPVLLSAEYVIDNNSDDVMSLSFGNCEANLLASGNATFNTLWEQAAAQGITVTVSAGDNGSAGCEDFNTATVATTGLAVNGIASTPFNIAVGGTDFDDVGTQASFWNTTPTGPGTRESALGYIHEVPWNDSCAATATPTNLTTCATANNVVAGSGGASTIYAKPAWQNGLTPTDSHRDLPDVSLFASDGVQSRSFYVVCQADALSAGSPPSCAPDSSGHFSFFAVGGTSASSPSFAGIIALIGQSEFNAGRSRRQGNASMVLYKIAATPANSCNSSTTPLTGSAICAFYDVTKGNNSVPCAGASSGCSSTTTGTNGVLVTTSGTTKTPAFTAAAGYDLATGLGTVNVANLAPAWPTALGAFKGTTSTLLINNSATPGAITHGTAVTAKVSVAVVAPATGTPTGDTAVLAPTGTVNGGGNDGTLANGTVTLSGVILPGGTYNATAHYAGDGTFAPSDSAGVPITVNKENSRLQYGIVTFDPNTGNITNTNSTSFVYGSPYILRFDILNSTTNSCTPLAAIPVLTGCAQDAKGTVTITNNGSPLDAGAFPVNSEGSGEDQPIQLTGGPHALSATYSGDNSYNPVTVAVLDNVTVSQATTATVLTSGANSVGVSQGITLSVAISTQSNSTVGPTGNVTFMDGTATIGTVATTPAGATATTGASATASINTSFTTLGTHALTAVYAGDANYATSTSALVNVTVTNSFSITAGALSPSPVTAGSSGTSTITVTPAAGSTGTQTVNVTCSTVPPGVTCTPSPLAINVTGTTAASQTLTVTVAAPSGAGATASLMPREREVYAAGMAPTRGGKGWWMLSTGTGLAAIALLLLPGRKRYRAALGLGLICAVSFVIGCGGGSSGGGGGGGGPVATTTQIKVTSATKSAGPMTFTFTATVTGGTPTDQVQLLDNGIPTGAAVAVSGGTANLSTAALSTVGTHSITAHYLGDTTNTLASSSGALNVTVTGITTVTIQASPAATNGSPTINLTIN